MDCGVPCLVVYRDVLGRPGHVVALVAETSDLTATSRAVSRAILLATAASVIVMILVSQAIVRRVTKPLHQLVRFARELAPNDSRRLPALGDDEINAVAEALNGMLDRLEHAQAALLRSEKLGLAGLMAARVAHDIRNPLSSIKMQTQLLRSRLLADPDDEATLIAVLHDIELVESVIRDLLELARPGELHLELISINVVTQEALRQLAAQFAHRRIAVVEHLAEGLPPVRLDPVRFKQALLNVLANASEAMPTGGTVTVTSRAGGDSTVDVEICDDGVGVDPALRDTVFDPFVSTKRDGMGLGLVNVKAVVENHGGRIALASRRPRGTCVTITLPPSSHNAPGRSDSHG
jgi:signal transduction histidine kinase